MAEWALYDGDISNIPTIGKVVTHVDDANYTLTNETLPGHIAHGTVTKSLVISEGAISVRDAGVGVNTGTIDWGANYAASPYSKGVDHVIKEDIVSQQLRHGINLFSQ